MMHEFTHRRSGHVGCVLLSVMLGSCASYSDGDVEDAQSAAGREWTDPTSHEVRFITVAPGVQLEVLEYGGEGQVLVFLAGLGVTAHLFDTFAPRFTDRYRVLAVTRRGHGASSTPDSGYDLASLVRDLVSVLDSLRIPQAVLVGHSYGGAEITRLAAAFPERVQHLVYLDAAHDQTEARSTYAVCPLPPAMTSSDSASKEAAAAYLERVHGVDWPDPLVGAWYSFDGIGGVEGPQVREHVIPLLFAGMEPPQYEPLSTPALAIYHVPTADWAAAEALPWYRALDEDGRAQVTPSCLAAVERYIAGSIDRFNTEMAGGRTLRIPGGTHFPFLAHSDVVEREMRFLIEKDITRPR